MPHALKKYPVKIEPTSFPTPLITRVTTPKAYKNYWVELKSL